MLIRTGHNQAGLSRARTFPGFTLVEVMVCITLLALVIAGVCYGYAEVNRIAIWDSMSEAGQAFAIRGMEAARAAKWNPWVISTNNSPAPGASQDELPPETNGVASLIQTNILDIPIKGNPLTNYTFYATNHVYVTWYPNTNYETEPPIRQIYSDCVWTFPLTGRQYTNIIITYRGPDQ
jgi:prepilin-type N-terminal cleavage/methylation domain-containing protein